MDGYFHDRRADDVLDDLYARTLVVQSSETTAALVVCDLIGLDRADTLETRATIEERVGIPSSQVMICCTHTHTGPITSPWLDMGMFPDEAYMNVLKHKIADAVQLAFQRRKPVSGQVAHGYVEGIAFNRRFWMKDGTLRTNPPLQSPEIVRPAGPIDTELGIIYLADAAGGPLALVSNYAVHPDQVSGTAFCADHEGVEVRILKQVLGQECAVLCPNGCCGDINHRDVTKPTDWNRGLHVKERSGAALAGEVVRRLVDMDAIDGDDLRAGNRTTTASFRVPSAEDLDWARKVIDGEMHGFDAKGLDIVKAHRMLRIHNSELAELPVEVSAIAIGDVALVGLPGEIFVELGLSVKQRSPFAHTFVSELCNDSIGYVPTQVAYGEGGYEATNNRFKPGTGELLVETALDLLNELHG